MSSPSHSSLQSYRANPEKLNGTELLKRTNLMPLVIFFKRLKRFLNDLFRS